jgi:hypothetical protein
VRRNAQYKREIYQEMGSKMEMRERERVMERAREEGEKGE